MKTYYEHWREQQEARLRTYHIADDTGWRTLRAFHVDDAAREYARLERIKSIERLDDLADHVEGVGGWLTLHEDGDLLYSTNEGFSR
jgi:hypothetical protein